MVKKINDSIFRKKVLNYFSDKGFNCVTQQDFPNIVAWRPFLDSAGKVLGINSQVEINGNVSGQVLIPYFVTFVECRKTKKWSKKEKKKAEKVVSEGRCNSFILAYQDKRELKFEELKNVSRMEITPEPTPSYLG